MINQELQLERREVRNEGGGVQRVKQGKNQWIINPNGVEK